VLAYLDALLDALSLRDTAEVHRLLGHPLVRILPEPVRDEVRALAAGDGDALAAPLRLMQLRHMTAQLLHDTTDAPVVADRPASAHAPPAEARSADVAREGSREPSLDPTRPTAVRPRRAGRLVQMELPLSA
jgi:hypothetical protein